MKQIINILKEYSNVLTVLLLILLVGSLLWFHSGDDDLKSLGINLVSDAIVLVVTIFILDSFVKKNEERKLMPAKMSTYLEVNQFVDLYVDFWRDTYELCVRNKKVEGVDSFFSADYCGLIWTNLNLNCPVSDPRSLQLVPEHVANYASKDDWWNYIPKAMQKFKDQGSAIMNMHLTYLDPEVSRYIHHIITSELINQLISLPVKKKLSYDHRDKSSNVFDKRPILKAFSGCKPSEEDYEAIVYLYKWCEKNYQQYSKINPGIAKNASYKVFGRTACEEGQYPRCMFID